MENIDVDNNKPIVFLLTQDLCSPSGLGRYFPMAKYLRRLTSEVTILALHSNYNETTPKQEMVDGVKVKYVAQMHVIKRGNTTDYFNPLKLAWISLFATWALFKACLLEHPGLIVVGKPHPMNGLAGFLVKYIQRCKIVVDCDDYETPSNHYQNKYQKAIVHWFEQELPKHANLVTTNTYFTKDRLIKSGVALEKTYYVPNGVDLERFPSADSTKLEKLRIDLGLLDHSLIGYIGSLNLDTHPVNLLLSAFTQVSQLIPKCRLMFVGGGKDLEKIKTLSKQLGIEDKVVFTGRIPPEQAYLYYQLCNVTVDPVKDDDIARGRSPLKMVESWACGVPFITMDVGDRKLLSGDPPSAIVVQANSQQMLKEALVQVLESADLRDQLTERGVINSKKYSWESIMTVVNGMIVDQLSLRM